MSASLLERRDPFPAWSGKNSRRSRRISIGGALHIKCERNSRVVPPFPESPRCLSPFQGNRFSCTASTFKPRINSHNCGTWDIPVGMPRGKATAPLIQAKGRVTLLLKLGRKAHVHPPLETRTDSPGKTPEVPQDRELTTRVSDPQTRQRPNTLRQRAAKQTKVFKTETNENCTDTSPHGE